MSYPNDEHTQERRKNTPSKLTEDQFREYTMESLEEGRTQFKEIKSDVATLSGHVNTLTGHIETLTSALAENTEFTKKTAQLAEKTASDTADLVKIAQFGKRVSRWGRFSALFLACVTDWASKLSKLLIPIFLVVAILALWWQGKPINWKDILEVLMK
jgi:ABC-type multidrug transport system fused ATPase/permease subunit